MEKIDRKFRFVAVNPCNGRTYTEDNAFIICAKDAAAVSALDAYREFCEALECGAEHLESIDLLIGRVRQFQAEIEIRTPDTNTDCEVDRCIGGIGL